MNLSRNFEREGSSFPDIAIIPSVGASAADALNDNGSSPPENGTSEIVGHRRNLGGRASFDQAPDEVALMCRSYATNIKFDH